MARGHTGSRPGRVLSRIRQDRGVRPLTAIVMVGFVVLVYVVVVIGVGTIVLGRATPSFWLSVLATAIVALAFEPVRRRVKGALARALHRDRTSPYQVLARFPATVTGSYPAEELPSRMARVLGEGTDTARAEVWLLVNGRLELAANWPAGHSTSPAVMDVSACTATRAGPAIGLDRPGSASIVIEGQRHSIAVRDRGELLGALTVVVHDGQLLTPVEERLFAGLAAQSGLVLRVAGLRAELEQQLAQLKQRTGELRRARRDLVARQDAERQRLERNIHDGAQQELIALLVNLRLAKTLLGRAPDRGVQLLGEQSAAARDTIATLTALSRGLYPPMLTDDGPVAALRQAVASGPIPVELIATDIPRQPAAVEAAVYFCCLEAVQNATKHSSASQIVIDIHGGDAHGGGRTPGIDLSVTDDGRGFDGAATSRGGLANLHDRVESLGGSVTITSRADHGTTVTAFIPTGPGVGADA